MSQTDDVLQSPLVPMSGKCGCASASAHCSLNGNSRVNVREAGERQTKIEVADEEPPPLLKQQVKQ